MSFAWPIEIAIPALNQARYDRPGQAESWPWLDVNTVSAFGRDSAELRGRQRALRNPNGFTLTSATAWQSRGQ